MHIELGNVRPHERVDDEEDGVQDREQDGAGLAQRGGRFEGRYAGGVRFASADNRENEAEDTDQVE